MTSWHGPSRSTGTRRVLWAVATQDPTVQLKSESLYHSSTVAQYSSSRALILLTRVYNGINCEGQLNDGIASM